MKKQSIFLIVVSVVTSIAAMAESDFDICKFAGSGTEWSKGVQINLSNVNWVSQNSTVDLDALSGRFSMLNAKGDEENYCILSLRSPVNNQNKITPKNEFFFTGYSIDPTSERKVVTDPNVGRLAAALKIKDVKILANRHLEFEDLSGEQSLSIACYRRNFLGFSSYVNPTVECVGKVLGQSVQVSGSR